MTSNVQSYLETLRSLLADTRVSMATRAETTLQQGCDAVVGELLSVRSRGGQVFLVGNGGSCAIASHMHNDLVKNLGIRAHTFHELPLLTATTNDDGYGRAFSDPLAVYVRDVDLLVCVSSSGRSENILRAARTALAAGARVVTLTGFDPDNELCALGHINFHVASHAYGLVESAHTVLTHLWTDAAKEALAAS